MLLMQHHALDVLHDGPDVLTKEPKLMAACYLPDAIRAYLPRTYDNNGEQQSFNNRVLSHFEFASPVSGQSEAATVGGTGRKRDFSWMQFPSQMGELSPDMLATWVPEHSHVAHVAPAPFGQLTNITAFCTHNDHLSSAMYHGLADHLYAQDMPFDDFVRSRILNLDDMENGNIYVRPGVSVTRSVSDNGSISDKDARNLVTAIEQHGMYVLASRLWDQMGITANQDWLRDSMAKVMSEEYPRDLMDKTLSFVTVDPYYNDLISNHDFSHMGKSPLPRQAYERFYDECLAKMNTSSTIGGFSRASNFGDINLSSAKHTDFDMNI